MAGTVPSPVLRTPPTVRRFALERGRQAALQAARALNQAKAPSHRLAEAGLRAGAIAHESFARLVRHQVLVIDALMDEGIERLHCIAAADSLRALIGEQIELLAATRARLSEDARRTLAIFNDTREELGTLFASSAAHAPARAATPTRRAPAARRKPAVRKKARKRAARRTR